MRNTGSNFKASILVTQPRFKPQFCLENTATFGPRYLTSLRLSFSCFNRGLARTTSKICGTNEMTMRSAYSVPGSGKQFINVSHYNKPRGSRLSSFSLQTLSPQPQERTTLYWPPPDTNLYANVPLSKTSRPHHPPLGAAVTAPRNFRFRGGGRDFRRRDLRALGWRRAAREGSTLAAGNRAAGGSVRLWSRKLSGGRSNLRLATQASSLVSLRTSLPLPGLHPLPWIHVTRALRGGVCRRGFHSSVRPLLAGSLTLGRIRPFVGFSLLI